MGIFWHIKKILYKTIIILSIIIISCDNSDLEPDYSNYNIPVKTTHIKRVNWLLIPYLKKTGCKKPILQVFRKDSSILKFKNSVAELEYLEYSDSTELKNNYENLFRILIAMNYDSIFKTNSAFYLKWKNKKNVNGNYDWEINEYTDTLYSNISKTEIEKMFRCFNGVYINEKIDTIVTILDYSTISYEFYENIKFIKNK